MKALIIAFALVTLVAAPSVAQPNFGPYSSSPASPNYGGGGY